ncbi:MAG: hypothetical protein IT235_06475, partial [Bacteroidia bacterium]|nr:hypothetical protein [Bacteroidia bacterium]
IKPNVFSSLKNHLYSTLLDCLRNFHTGNGPVHKIRELMYHAEILFHKKLFSPCLKSLENAHKIAERFELLSYYLEVTEFIQLVKEEERDVKWLETKLPEIFRKEKEILMKIANLMDFRKGRANAVIFGFKKFHDISGKNEFFFQDFVDTSILKNNNHARSYKANVYFLLLKGFQYYYNNDMKNALKIYIRLKQLLENNEDINSALPGIYSKAIHNILTVGLGILSFEEIKKHFYQLKNPHMPLLKENTGFAAGYYNNLLRIYTYYYINHKVEQVIEDVETWLSKNESKADKLNVSSMIYFLSHICFFNGYLKRSVYWLNSLINNYSERVENYVYSSARLLALVLNYELGNYEQIPYLAKSTRRFLLKRKQLFEFEKIMLDFFSIKLPGLNEEKKERLRSFKKLRKNLQADKKSELRKRRVLQYFDVFRWIDSKIEEKTYMDIIKKKGDPYNEKNKLLTAES